MKGLKLKSLLLLVTWGAVLAANGVEAQVPSIAFEPLDTTVEELKGSVEICVRVIEGTITSESSFTLSTIAVSADGNDFTAFNDLQLTLFVGETRVCETLGITQDDGVEGEEILELTIASSTLRLGSPSEIAITILDSDTIGIGFDPVSYTVDEGGTPVDVCVSRLSGTLRRRLTVTLSVLTIDMSAGNASSEIFVQDYIVVTLDLDLESAISRVCESFGAVNDVVGQVLEDLEFYQISLTTPEDDAVVDPALSLANVFIRDNDAATVSIQTPTTISLPEGNNGDTTPVQVCLELDNIQAGLERSLDFSLSVALGTADDDDFTRPSTEMISFSSSSMVDDVQCLEYSILGDVFKETDDTFTISVTSMNNINVISGVSQVSVTIEDDNDLVQFCEGLDDPVDGSVDVPSTLEGSVATYSCDVGHNLVEGDMTRTCERNANTIPGDWSGTAPECMIVDCGAPPGRNEGGEVVFSTTTYLSEAMYSCPMMCDLLTPPDAATLTCQASGMWFRPDAPTCEVIDCGPPPSPGGCVIAAQTLNPTECGSVVMYSPIENYTIVGDTSLMCGVNGQWEPDVGEALPVCFPTGICPIPPGPTGVCEQVGSSVTVTSTEADAVIVYSCARGCVLNPLDGAMRTCERINMTHGDWSGSVPSCDPVICDEVLTDPLNGMVEVPEPNVYLAVANYTCDEAYVIQEGQNDTRICGADGMWSGNAPLCVPVECPALPIENGIVSMTNNNSGGIANYTCDDGFTLVGVATRTCQSNGEWSGSEPDCFMDCEEDSIAIDNIGDDGMIEGSEMQHGSMINYTCADMCSYKRTCTDGTWQGNEPDCPVTRCTKLEPTNSEPRLTEIIHTADNPVAGTVATYRCEFGVSDGFENRTCGCDGQWSVDVPECASEDDENDNLPLYIGIGVAVAVLLAILIIVIICCIACCVKSRKKKRDKQYENYYRDFMRPYTTPYNAQSSTSNDPRPIEMDAHTSGEKAVPPWEEETRQHADTFLQNDDEEEDELPSPTPSDDNMSEYRLRLHDVETQSTGSQHHVKPQIVAERVE